MGFHVSLGECTNLARIEIKKSKSQSLKRPLKQGFVMPSTCDTCLDGDLGPTVRDLGRDPLNPKPPGGLNHDAHEPRLSTLNCLNSGYCAQTVGS